METEDYVQQYMDDIYLFNKGQSFKSYYLMGAHHITHMGQSAVRFVVWAPNAKKVQVVGDFNDWNGDNHELIQAGSTGVWVGIFTGISDGQKYKYKLYTSLTEFVYKTDPYGYKAEQRPKTASIIHGMKEFSWNDTAWMNSRKESDPRTKPINIYEVHLGSWKHENGKFLTYSELVDTLIPYVKEMGYTHIELMPIMEHPFDGSWGYQLTGYYSVTSRYGEPEEFKYFVNACHKNNIGVILDWVPGHFCKDEHGLHLFDGTWLYGKHEHPHWGTVNFDFSKKEVISFLVSNAYFWFEQFHVDGLRVDGVTSMLYLDYGYDNREQAPKNNSNGYANIDAENFLKLLNKVIFKDYPGVLMIAEESSAWPLVTRPTYSGGLGFNYKWDMGWMNDTLKYMSMDPIYRKYHHNLVTFSMHYAFSENFICSISHDEVVHGKKSLIDKMSGSYEDKFAQLRLLLCYMMFHPGKKLLFMGCEFAQFIEWRYNEPLEWNLLSYPMHDYFHKFVKDLNHLYLKEKSLWEIDHDWGGFTWIDADNRDQSIFIFIRKDLKEEEPLLILINFTPQRYKEFSLGTPYEGDYELEFYCNNYSYGKEHDCYKNYIKSKNSKDPIHNQPYNITINVEPFSCYCFKYKSYKSLKLEGDIKDDKGQRVI